MTVCGRGVRVWSRSSVKNTLSVCLEQRCLLVAVMSKERGHRAAPGREVLVGLTVLESQRHLNAFFGTLDLRVIDDELLVSAATWMLRRVQATYVDYVMRVKVTNDRCDPRCLSWALVTIQSIPGYTPQCIVVALHTHPDHRREGLGGSLVLAAIQLAQESDVKRVALQCRPHNTSFYEKFGFAVCTDAPSHAKSGDFLQMCCDL